jgi:cytochrome c biogenesis protein
LGAFRGDLGMDAGVPQNVYRLDTSKMVKIGLGSLKPGETWTLPGKSGSITFSGLDRYATFQIAFDPGKELALGAVAAALAGLILSLFVRRRRIWVKVSTEPGRGCLVQVAALAKNEGADLSEDVNALADHLAGSDAADDRSAP